MRGSEDEIVTSFLKKRKLLYIHIIIITIMGIIAMVLFYKYGMDKKATAAIMVVSGLWSWYIHKKLWRCPSCDGHLGRLYIGLKLPKFCPECGVKLI